VRCCRGVAREIYAAEGFDECEPWLGFPAGPKKTSWNYAAGGNHELPAYWQKLVDHWKATYPHWIGRQ
jgi:hypothetical protein